MIDLSHSTPFASGYNRHCYRHPDDPELCLKVIRPENIEARYRRQSWPKKVLGKARLDDNLQEQAAHRQAAIRRLLARGQDNLVWAHLPRFYGTWDTTAGPANASQLLQSADGAPADTLEHYLQHRGFDQPMAQAVERFGLWLRQTGILTRNLLPHNLVVVEHHEQPQLYLIDGLGAPSVPEKLAVLPAWRARYIARRLRRLHLRIQWELSDRSQSWESAQKL